MITLEEAILRKLKTTQHILCTVESCTGGLLAHLVTSVPGSSEIFWGGFIPYDNTAKIELGVPPALLEKYGAVSPEVACALAEQGLNRMKATLEKCPSTSLIKPRGFLCLSTTGIAGPSGGTKEKPVGLCFVGVAQTGHPTLIEKFQAKDLIDRLQNKTQFAHRALEMIR